MTAFSTDIGVHWRSAGVLLHAATAIRMSRSAERWRGMTSASLGLLRSRRSRSVSIAAGLRCLTIWVSAMSLLLRELREEPAVAGLRDGVLGDEARGDAGKRAADRFPVGLLGRLRRPPRRNALDAGGVTDEGL